MKQKSQFGSFYEALLNTEFDSKGSWLNPELLPETFQRPTLRSLARQSSALSPRRATLARLGGGGLRTNLKADLQSSVKKILADRWSERAGEVVPAPENLQLGNDADILDATVLYADLSGSTSLVDNYNPHFAAEIYKTYLACAAPILKHEGGTITAYDGDRIMAVYIGKRKNTSAVRAALKINGAVWDIIKPALSAQYPNTDYILKHVVGVDTSKLLVCRIGVRNDNDLVWVGRAANYAAKLSSLSDTYSTYITNSVYDAMHDDVKYAGVNRQNMWDSRLWTAMNNLQLYASTWKIGL
jgi:class 3 adenylate cyclase